MRPLNILFFADRLPPLIGGMEMHAGYFIEHFTASPRFPLSGVITKNAAGKDCLITKDSRNLINLKRLPAHLSPTVVFFNSGRWIEELSQIRDTFPKAIFIYRTGGNEILKAPLIYQKILDHSLRQSYWVKQLNSLVDILITNSGYTEQRLLKLGITCPFVRCVGGVNTAAFKSVKRTRNKYLTIFCAARFVPYKNHSLLLSVIHHLVSRGYKLRLRFAGDGPLLLHAKEQVLRDNLSSVVEFLGVLDNKEVCHEIMRADVYMQLSTDQITEVPGGSYIHSEGMGRSILEALSAGTFVVVSQSGAFPEVVTGDRGVLVELGDAAHIANQLMSVFKNIPIRHAFSEEFSWARVFNRYEELFRDNHENLINYRKM
ncbi:glycosyltransferase family 4 protein [Candidatus Paracaedibacter symbiosus]|uniref:glycosyltransferase family 4 protein n=1 Tax=Candidatus Paracaedibacter symbiosus TaxID=244582 RepID=UPI0005096ED8|nr:glycosyltransferase family 4 protein [Candidatus Paracaedibacter symbiosus]